METKLSQASSSNAEPSGEDQEERSPEADETERLDDPAGVAGVLAGVGVLGCLMLGIMIPVLPWILSGVFGVVALICAVLARTNLRWFCLATGLAGLIPPILFIVVQTLPQMQR